MAANNNISTLVSTFNNRTINYCVVSNRYKELCTCACILHPVRAYGLTNNLLTSKDNSLVIYHSSPSPERVVKSVILKSWEPS